MIESGRADRAQQHRVGAGTGIKGRPRQRQAPTLDGHPAGIVFGELKVVAVNVCYLAQDKHGLFGNFRADSVTRKDDYV